jgi:hypothetical protein
MVRVNPPQRSSRFAGRCYKNTVLCLLITTVFLSISTIILSLRITGIHGDYGYQTVTPPNKFGREGSNRSSSVVDRPKITKNIVDDKSSHRSNSHSPPHVKSEYKQSNTHQSPVFKSIQGATAGTKNSEIYQPVKAGKRLLTYKRFGGRLNNQLFQFITALQHAKVLKRTFVVPDEVREVDWTGMFDTTFGIWDIDRLNAAYDIDWRSGLSQDFQNSIPEECVLSPVEGRALLNSGPQLWEEWDRMCPDVIDLAGNTGLLFCKQQHQFCGDSEAQLEAYQIYSHFALSPSLLQHIPSKKEVFKGKGYDELAIHSRRAGEGMYDWEMCVKGNSRTCRGHVEDRRYCDERTMKGNCAIWLDIDYQIKSKKFLKKNEKDYRFVLASDGTHDWNIDFDGQFIVANNTDWLLELDKRIRDEIENGRSIQDLSVSSFAREKLAQGRDLSPLKSSIDAVTATLLDLFSLVDSKYLLGGYYSTLSLNACFLRGLGRMYDSNMCWMLMHPNSKYSAPPPEEDAVHLNDNDGMPPALESDVEHAFVRSNDGNFIAIDRYLIPYKKNKRERKATQIIGVLGDGLVPLTIEKNKKGEESIRADFTCSYGNAYSPATIILMKGDNSYEEHYYKRGEKYDSPFSTNGDRFRTLLILCEELRYDKSLSRHPPLILSSNDGKFHIRIGSSFARPVAQPRHERGPEEPNDSNKKKVVHCLNPTYGLKDPKWLIEYIEYHIAIGVDHFHVYNVDMHSPEVQSVLEMYRKWNFITRHDWSAKASGKYTTRVTYEHAKWAAQTDCALRSRGLHNYALFSDIDEVAMGGTNGLAPALELCEQAHTDRGVIGCSFNSKTVSSVFTKLTDDEEMKMKDKLLLERYSNVDAESVCRGNCRCLGRNCEETSRKYHYGRQKYMLNMNDLSIPPRPLWTHAIGRDYDEMDKIMEQLPDDVFHIRHYQGHWLKKDLDTMEEKYAPLPSKIIDLLRKIILTEPSQLQSRYARAKEDSRFSGGVEWVTPVDRPAKYHNTLLT